MLGNFAYGIKYSGLNIETYLSKKKKIESSSYLAAIRSFLISSIAQESFLLYVNIKYKGMELDFALYPKCSQCCLLVS